MALQRNTVILLAIAVFVGGLSYVLIERSKLVEPTVATQSQGVSLFEFTEAQITEFSIELSDQKLVFRQQADSLNQWSLVEPERQLANRGAIAFLLELLVNYQGEEPFTVTAAQLADYGLTEPYCTITVKLVDGSERKLILGSENFDQTKIYALTDGGDAVWILPLDFKNAVTREFTEWIESPSTTDVSDDIN